MVEMKETNVALMNATRNSLLLFDEIGRGTATYDGMALAQAIIEYVHNNIHAKTLFSTHYHELTILDESLDKLQNVHVGAIEKNGELIFLHKMQEGPADKSYGIHVAKLAGMPDKLLKRADSILNKLESENDFTVDSAESYAEEKHIEEKNENETSEIQEEQLSLFQPEAVSLDSNQSKILKEIKNANLMGMTPMDVMNIVFKWQKELNKKG